VFCSTVWKTFWDAPITRIGLKHIETTSESQNCTGIPAARKSHGRNHCSYAVQGLGHYTVGLPDSLETKDTYNYVETL